jgi:hypothetical protein
MQFRECITNISLSSALISLYKEVLTSSQVLSNECQREFSQMNLTFSPKRRFASNKRCISFEVHHAGWSTVSKILPKEIGRFLINIHHPTSLFLSYSRGLCFKSRPESQLFRVVSFSTGTANRGRVGTGGLISP